MVVHGGALVLHEAGMTRMTASGLQAKASYQVGGRASTGIFADARGAGEVTVDVATGHETLSGKLILARQRPDRLPGAHAADTRRARSCS
jgi:hypothetical protein